MTTIAATGVLRASWLLLAFPIFGAVVLLVGGRRTDKWGHLLGVAMPVASFVYAVIAFFALLGDRDRSQDLHLYSFIAVGRFQANIGILLDPLSVSSALSPRAPDETPRFVPPEEILQITAEEAEREIEGAEQ